MIRARVDAAHSVGTSRQAGRDLGGQEDAIASRVVETLEEREFLRVQRLSRFQRRERLNDYVTVAFNNPISVDGLQAASHKGTVSKLLYQKPSKGFESIAHLRCRIVLDIRTRKPPSNEVPDSQLQGERLVLLQARIEISRKDELGRRLLVLSSESAHLLCALGNENQRKRLLLFTGIGLHDPAGFCWPSVKGAFWVKQKLMKLFLLVSEAICSGSTSRPVSSPEG